MNDAKTQLLCVNPKGNAMRSYIKTEDGNHLISGDSLKILGFTFGPVPDASLYTNLLVKKFNSKAWSLKFLKRSGMKERDLMNVYKTVIRPVLDFASVAYHSILTEEQSFAIERLQMRAMKTVCGELVSYRTVLDSNRIETMRARRTEKFEKFARKSVSNAIIKDKWFPPNNIIARELRRREEFFIPRLRTERAKKSPIIQMRKFLNNDK